jgi:cytochrome c556
MNRSLLAATAVLTFATALPAAAQFQRPTDAVAYRKGAFQVMANHFGRIGAMVNNRVPFDAAAAQANADLVVTMSKLPFAAFVDGTETVGNSRAKPVVWTERAKFDAAAKKMQEEAVKLQAAARTGDLAQIRAAFGATGASCKACHDDFQQQ